MRAILFADLTNRVLSPTLGGSAFQWPVVVQGDTLTLGFRPAERRAGVAALADRTLQGIRASIGRRDARPTAGTIRFQIGNPATSPVEGTNLTTALGFGFSEGDLQTALNALSAKPAAATVIGVDGSFVVSWAAQTDYTVLTPRSNRLRPISSVDILQYVVDGDYLTELRLKQSPVAFADTYEPILPPPPVVTQILNGGSSGDVEWDEVQKLYIPPTFAGAFYLARGFRKTAAITVADTVTTIAEKLNAALVDDGEVFTVEPIEGQNAAMIRWGGDLGGTAQDLLDVVVMDAPAGDPTINIALDRAELAAIMRNATNGTTAAEIKLPLEIEFAFENEADDAETDTITFLAEVVIKAEVTLGIYGVPENIDFLRPPSPVNYRPRGAGQIANGVLHWSGPRGNGVATSFAIDHNLATDIAFPTVRRNISNGELLRPGTDYGVTYGNNNTLTITMLGDWITTPADTDELLIAILGMAQASQYDAHTHSIAEVDDLQDTIDALSASIAALEANAAAGSAGSPDAEAGAVIMEQVFRRFAEVYPTGAALAADVVGVAGIDQSKLAGDGDLLGAVHDAAAVILTDPKPTPSAANKSSVYQNRTLAEVRLSGGGGRSSYKLQPGEFCASDGRRLFPVIATGVHNGAIAFTADAGTDTLSLPDFTLADGTAVMCLSAGTLPAGISSLTALYVINAAAGTCKLSATLGGSAVNITDAGTGLHYLFAIAGTTTSFFPRDFERELFVAHVSGSQLQVKKTATAKLGFESAILNTGTPAARNNAKITQGRWRFLVEIGLDVSEASPATTRGNLKKIAWQTTPVVDEIVYVARDTAAIHTFGARIKRTGASAWTVEQMIAGTWSASAATLATAAFWLRARLTEWDVEDVADAEGVVVLLGPDKVPAADASGFGKLVIQ